MHVPAHAQPPDSGYDALSDCDSDPVAIPVSRSVSASTSVSAFDCGFGAECHSHSASDSVAVSPSAPASASAVSLVVLLIRMRLVFDSGLACHAQKKKNMVWTGPACPIRQMLSVAGVFMPAVVVFVAEDSGFLW